MPKTEVERFLEGVKTDEVVEGESDSKVPAKDDLNGDPDPEKVSESLKNRQHRRMQAKIQVEREANIILNERLKAMEESLNHVTKEVKVDDRIRRIFGDDTPEKVELGKHFTEILAENKREAKEEAKREAIQEMERAKKAEQDAVKSYESKIESGLESIEDEYGVDLTSESSVEFRKKFLDFVSKIAPKDEEGSPIELPDLVGAYEIFKSTSNNTPKNNRQKEIASRSMQQSGQANIQKEEITEGEKWLVQNGIIKKRQR